MQYIILDLENLQLIAKVNNHIDGCYLMDISCSNLPCSVQPFNTPDCFSSLTQYSLSLLLKNICGNDYSKCSINQLQVLAVSIFENCETLDYKSNELQIQADWVFKNKPQERFIYVKGSTKPTIYGDGQLYIKLNPLVNEQEIINDWYKIKATMVEKDGVLHSEITAVLAKQREEGALVPLQSKTANLSTSTPKIGSVRDTIWTVADKLWDEINKSQDIKLILAMRKKAMSVLEEEYGVKKTSSSNELGKWQKERITIS